MQNKLIMTTTITTISLLIAFFYHEPTLANSHQPKSKLNVVLLGDSYSAGNGADHYTGVKNCYRSQRNWAQLYVNYLNNQGVATTFQNRACSGSTTNDLLQPRKLAVYDKTTILAGDYTANKNWILNFLKNNKTCEAYTVDDTLKVNTSITRMTYQKSRNATLVDYKCHQTLRPQLDFVGPETDLVLMTIGGNDIEFAKIVEQCFFFRSKSNCTNLINQAKNKLPDLKEKLNKLLGVMRTHGLRSNAKVVLLGYPLLSMNVPYYIGPSWDPYFVAQEIRQLGLAGNQAQAEAVALDNQKYPNQVMFINNIPAAFNGHEPHPAFFQENPNRWIHEFSGYSILDRHGFYHPNPTGHINYASVLSRSLSANIIKQFAQPITSKSADIDVVFNIDTSGSMNDLLEHTKQKIKTMIEQIRATSASARFAITTFRDYPERSGHIYDYPARVNLNFSSDLNQIQQTINDLNLGDGGDTPETALSGILSGLNLPWRAGVHKTIVTVTDAPPHNPEPISGLTAAQIIQRAFEVDPAELYFINIGQNSVPSYNLIAQATGGKVFHTTTDMVSDIFIQSIDLTTSKPHAWINGPYIAKLGQTIEIDGAGSYSKIGKIIKYEWDFESDGRIDFTSTQPLISRTFNKELYGFMTLKVTDDQGLSNIANTHLIISQDGDDVPTAVDNCPLIANHSQTDSDRDGIGDVCDETRGVRLPEEGHEYYECLIKQHFHPEVSCQHLAQIFSQTSQSSPAADQPASNTLISTSPQSSAKSKLTSSASINPESTLQTSLTTTSSAPQQLNLDQSNNSALPTSITPEKNTQQLNHNTPQSTDPKWLWISLPITIASLFGGYFILQKRQD